MRALVTGGAGFIGSHLTEELLKTGEVIVLDNLSTGKRQNLPGGVELVEADISKQAGLDQIKNDFDVIFHLAAQTSVGRSLEEPLKDFGTNAAGTLNVLEFARKGGSKVVYASSCACYGDAAYLPVDEKHPLNPKSPYAAGKVSGEKLCGAYASAFDLPTVSLRYFNVYGPRQQGDCTGVISVFLQKAMESQPLKVFGDGEQFRDFIYVKDVVDATIKAGEKCSDGQFINIGSGKKTVLNDVIQKVLKASGTECEVEYQPERPGEIKGIYADVGLAKEMLGFEAQTGFEEGIKKTHEWLSGK